MGFGTRRPTSNDPPPGHSPWGGDEFVDDVALLLTGIGARCRGCQRVTRIKFLKSDACPDCQGKNPGRLAGTLTDAEQWEAFAQEIKKSIDQPISGAGRDTWILALIVIEQAARQVARRIRGTQ